MAKTTTASNVTTETTVTTPAPAATTKAPKVTLNSIVLAVVPSLPALAEGQTEHAADVLEAHENALAAFVKTQAASLTDYLVDKSDEAAVIGRIFTAAVELIPSVLEREAENIAKRKADREANRHAAKKAKEAKSAEEMAKLEETKKAMLKVLLESGMDLETAKVALEAGMKAKLKAAAAPVVSYERVTIEYNGKQHEMPVKGNMSGELKAIVAESKLDRDDFIKQYKVEPAATEADASEESENAAAE